MSKQNSHSSGRTIICAVKGSGYPLFTDNIEGKCAACGADIVYRPYMEQIETKICIHCGLKVMKNTKVIPGMLPESLDELGEIVYAKQNTDRKSDEERQGK